MILIISATGDPAARLVLAALRERGAALAGRTGDLAAIEAAGEVPVVWWDTGDYPARSRLTTTFTAGRARSLLDTGEVVVDLGRVTSAWRSRPTGRRAVTVADPSHRAHAEAQADFMLDGALGLSPARWLPGLPADERRAHNKIFHTAKAAELGFTVPDTVYTNDPGELVAAYDAAGGDLVAKLLVDEAFTVDGSPHRVFTTVVGRRQLTSRHLIAHAPVILQPYVPKAVELRVIVVGSRVLAAEIDVSASAVARDDWRHYDNDRVAYRPHALPEGLAGRCARLVAEVGLSYAALDFIVTPAGEHVFLELNSNGAWGFVELWAGLPVSAAIADWLLGAR